MGHLKYMSGRCVGTIIKLFGEYIKSIMAVNTFPLFPTYTHILARTVLARGMVVVGSSGEF